MKKVTFENNEYLLLQDAFLSDDGMHYLAPAKKGEKFYMVVWDTTEEWNNLSAEDKTDESLACDWDNPVEVNPV